jgi:hypothetical protein
MTALYEYRVEFDDPDRDSEIIESILPPVEGFEEEFLREYPDPERTQVFYVGRVA